MNTKAIKHIVSLCLLAAALACPSVVRADEVVLPGWNLFQTLPSSHYWGTYWQGVPLETFDFGTGPLDVNNTDTIMQRLNIITSVDVPSPIQIVALQLRTVNPLPENYFGIGTPEGYYYATLNTAQPSSGTMTIDSFPAESSYGTFDDSFNVYFDLRFGSLGGPIVALDQLLPMGLEDALWDRDPNQRDLTLTGINYLLNGVDTSGDFWPGAGGKIVHDTGGGHHDVVVSPEPMTGFLLGLGALSLSRKKR